MYAPTAHQPAAMPRQASYVRFALWHYAPAPYAPRRYGQGRSMAQALAAKGVNPLLARRVMAYKLAKLAQGQPLHWPK